MDPAGAAKLARRLHRGELDETGAPYVEHPERAAALVAAEGGGLPEQMAAWLHGVARTGMTPADLAALRVPHRVIRIVRALTPHGTWEPAASRADRIRACPGAPLVLGAVIADEYRARSRMRAPADDLDLMRADRDRDLLLRLGQPLPASLAEFPAGRVVQGAEYDADAVLARLTPRDPGRWHAVQALRDAGERRALRPLIDAYRAAEAGDRRWAKGKTDLMAAVSRIASRPRYPEDPQLVELLVSLTGDRDPFLRMNGIDGLAGVAEYQPLVVRALSDPSANVVSSAVEALEPDRIGSVVEELIATARRPEREWGWARRGAAQALIRAADPRARQVLLDVLAEGLVLRQDFLRDLAKDLDRSVIPRLIGQLRSRVLARDGIAFVLGELRAAEAVSDLCAIARGDHDGHQVLTCIVALGKIADKAAVPTLVEASRHRDALVRVAALDALARFDGPEAGEAALVATDDFDPDVRDRAVRLLAARGGPEATGRLLMFCDGPQAPAVLRGLARIADERALPLLRRVFLTTADRRVRDLAGRAITSSARAGPQLMLWPGMPLPQLRAAVWVYGETGSAAATSRLTRLLTHRDEVVRARAAAALGKTGDAGAASDLRGALADISPRVRASAASALGAIGDREARKWLTPLRDDPRSDVRMAAAAALRRLANAR